MKTAVWLYLFMFVAFFDLHAQYPMLSPFALSLGAAPSFIGLIMGVYSLTHLPGNLLAGVGVDRYGSKYFIVGSLLTAGITLVLQAQVTDPWQLLWVRSISGFVLAFLSPACLAMLAKIAKNQVQQGKLMAGNGFVHTLASVGSPAAGAFLVAKLGFTTSFLVLGWGLIATGILALFGIRETKAMRRSTPPADAADNSLEHIAPGPANQDGVHGRQDSDTASGGRGGQDPRRAGSNGRHASGLAGGGGRDPRLAVPSHGGQGPGPNRTDTNGGHAPELSTTAGGGIPWLFFGIPLALSCSQGILFFELPLMKAAMDSIVTSGLLFTMVSLGALATLSLLFLNRIAPLPRVVAGSLSLALVFFGMAVDWPLPLVVSLFMIGMAKGVIYPAIATLLAGHTARTRYGRVFSLLAISYSLGAFFGPTVAGHLRDAWSPYFIAFVVLMLGLSLLPLDRFRMLGSPAAG